MNATCYACHFRKNLEMVAPLGDEKTATAFAKDLMQLYLESPEDVASPWFEPGVTALLEKHYGITGDRYIQEKLDSNRFVMERFTTIQSRVQAQSDPVYAGLQFSILGNYLDFSALRGQVSYEKLDEMLDLGLKMDLDRDCYARLCRDLESAKTLLYLTDNAGEIGFDRIFAEEIRKKYPHLQITFCLRGGPVLNDATREDAEAVGVDFPLIDNGNCIDGTVLSLLGEEAKAAFENADVILAKGMGNNETLYGCGYNVYYAFLVKCKFFEERFGKPLMTPMLVAERT
jgi:uncharacterized protein with ATP-grasp and redox domains